MHLGFGKGDARRKAEDGIRGEKRGKLAIGEAGATNAGILAAQILALSDDALAARLSAWRSAQTAAVPEMPGDHD